MLTLVQAPTRTKSAVWEPLQQTCTSCCINFTNLRTKGTKFCAKPGPFLRTRCVLCYSNLISIDTEKYAFASQAKYHGLDPKEAIIELSPRDGEFCLREEDILDTIAKEGNKIALVIFSGIQYYTGQLFPMRSITKAAKEQVIEIDMYVFELSQTPAGMHLWLGSCPRGRECPTLFARLGRRLCCLVHLQVHELWTRRYCRALRAR